MISGAITIRDTETPKLARIRGLVKRPKALNAAAGKRAERELKKHFLGKDREGNRRGWVRSHFWNQIRQSTALTVATDTGAIVEIAHPAIEQKIRGGIIRAKRGRNLAIPLTDKAKAAGSPREWNDPSALVPIKTKRGLFLVLSTYQAHTGSSIKGQRLIAMYKLTPSVNQDKDPTALPPEGAIESALDDEAEKFLAREEARSS